MVAMHIEAQGEGAPLLLIHGWGMHSGMWGKLAVQLAQSCRVYTVDLPGHGKSESSVPYHLDGLVEKLREHFNETITLCGWSLGGQVAMRWAQLHPAQIDRLALLATTPCFVQREGWDCAMAADTLQEFAASLLQNHALTLRRFLALQVRGSEDERELLADLRAQLFSRGEPDVAALKGGLEILRDTDLRAALPSLTQPTLVLAGERDTITPLAAAQYTAQALPNANLLSIKGAAHAPFLSHPQIVLEALQNFMDTRQA